MPTRLERTPARLAWPAAAALAPVLVAVALAGPGATLVWRDTARILAPIRPLVVDALRHGRLPLWNPHGGTGAPLLGDAIHGVLHPLSVLAALLGGGVEPLLLLYLAAAGLGAYVAARRFGASRAAAAVAGVGYGASGVVLGCASLVPYLASAATIPWVLAAARVAGRGEPFGVPLVAAAVAATVLGGDFQAAAVAAALALAVAAEAGGARGLARALAGVALAAALGAVQLWPSWAVMERSQRAGDLDPSTFRQWALHPWRLLELVAPGFVAGRPGALLSPAFVALEPASPYRLPFLPSALVGVPLLVAAAGGSRGRAGKLLLALCAVLLWVALGHRLGAQQLLAELPVWRSFRYPEKMVVPLALLVALLAARGADAAAGEPGARRRLLVAAIAVAGVAGGAGLAYLALVPGGAAGPLAGAVAADASAGLLWLAAALAATLAWLALAARRPPAAAAALAGLVAVHAAATAPFSLHAMPTALLRPPPPLEAAPPGPRLETPPVFDVPRPDAPDAVTALAALETEAATANHNVAFGLDNVDLSGAMVSRRFELLWAVLGEERWAGFRRFGVTHVAVPRNVLPPLRPMAARATAGGAALVEGRAVVFHAVPHRPWASFAPAVRAVPGQRDTLAAVRDAVRGGDPTVVLEAPSAPPVAPGRILAVERRAESIAVEAEADGDAVLVVNDAFFPGWVATVDGAPAPILPADVLVRAVPFPRGRHRLEMRYAPPEVGLGLAVSAAGAAAALALVVVEARRRRVAAASA